MDSCRTSSVKLRHRQHCHPRAMFLVWRTRALQAQPWRRAHGSRAQCGRPPGERTRGVRALRLTAGRPCRAKKRVSVEAEAASSDGRDGVGCGSPFGAPPESLTRRELKDEDTSHQDICQGTSPTWKLPALALQRVRHWVRAPRATASAPAASQRLSSTVALLGHLGVRLLCPKFVALQLLSTPLFPNTTLTYTQQRQARVAIRASPRSSSAPDMLEPRPAQTGH